MAYYILRAATITTSTMIPLAWTYVQIVIGMIVIHSAGSIAILRPFKNGEFESIFGVIAGGNDGKREKGIQEIP